MDADSLPPHVVSDDETYVPDWVFFGDVPRLSYAEKVEAYKADQALRFSSSSRAEYERKKSQR